MALKILVPVKLTDAMLTYHDIAEPNTASGEVAWVSGGAVALGDVRILAATHRKYEALIAHTGRAITPNNDPTYWADIAPTDRWAALDSSASTSTAGTGNWVCKLMPGYCNAVALRGISNGATVTVTVRDGAGGAIVASMNTDTIAPPYDWLDYVLGPIRYVTASPVLDIPLGSTFAPEVTVSVTGASPSVAMILVGTVRPINLTTGSSSKAAAPSVGAAAEIINWSIVDRDKRGMVRIIPGRSGVDLSFSVSFATDNAPTLHDFLTNIKDTPVLVTLSDDDKFRNLASFGLLKGKVVADDNYSKLTATVTSIG